MIHTLFADVTATLFVGFFAPLEGPVGRPRFRLVTLPGGVSAGVSAGVAAGVAAGIAAKAASGGTSCPLSMQKQRFTI